MQDSIIRVPFVKMHGAGNNYVYIDDVSSPFPFGNEPEMLEYLARDVSDIHYGIGSDGLIAISPSLTADFRMRMYNADGSEAQMCGNGIRCVGKYVHDRGLTDKTELKIETLAGVKRLELHLDSHGRVKAVTVDMGKAVLTPEDIPVVTAHGGEVDTGIDIRVNSRDYRMFPIGMGNPHGVIFIDEITDADVLGSGPLLETTSVWPQKANIEFIRVVDRGHLEMRVWERGSGETWACGTGACAAAVAAFRQGLTADSVEILLRGGVLNIRFDKVSGHVWLTGGADFIAEGVYFFDK